MTDRPPDRPTDRPRETGRSPKALWWVSGVCAAIMAVVGVYSTRLRPIADDYCFAAMVGRSYFAGLADYYRTTSGDLVVIFTNSTLVGLPVVHLPWWLASAVTFWFALAVVVAATLACVRAGLGGRVDILRLDTVRSWLVAAPVVGVLWLAYWWAPVIFRFRGELFRLEHRALSITMWQNINAAYVVPAALVLLAFGLWGAEATAGSRRRNVALLLVGVVVGLSGPVLAVSVLGMCVLLALYAGARCGLPSHESRKWQLLAAGVVVGFSSTTLSPGFGERSESAGVKGVSSLLDPGVILRDVLWEGFADLLMLVIVAGPVVAVPLSWAAGRFLTSRGAELDHDLLRRRGIGLALFALLMIFVNRASEVLVYEGFWHQVSVGVVLFVASILVGLGWSNAAVEGDSVLDVLVPRSLLAAVALTGLLSVWVMTIDISERHKDWEFRAEPVSGINDIGARFVAECWVELGTQRDLPERRGLSREIATTLEG